jgi:hypothetical protein
MLINFVVQIDKMNYWGVCSVEEYERLGIEQAFFDSLRSGVHVNVLQFNNVECLRAEREPDREE